MTNSAFTLRLGAESPSIARGWLMSRVIRPCISKSEKPFFRVVEFNVLSNHVHLLCEADDAVALARGVQGLAIRLARRLNRALIRKGKLFGARYHAVALRSPAQVRNTLRYVLLHRTHHAPRAQKFYRGWLDPFSSAVWFAGWDKPMYRHRAHVALARVPAPTRPARTWLLRIGWRRAGPLSFDERPD